MKKFLNILKIAGIALLPQNAFRSPMRAAVWSATAICILWSLAACFGIVKTHSGPLEALATTFWVTLTLFFTVLCEAATEHLSREQTSALKAARASLKARKVDGADLTNAGPQMSCVEIAATSLLADDLVIVAVNEMIPADGEVVLGIAAVDESALTGESAPVIREPGEERASVTAGTKVLSDWIIIRVKTVSGESFIDRMISMVEGTKRQRTPTEISIEAILTLLTILFLVLSIAVSCLSSAWASAKGSVSAFGPVETIGLFLCLAPTTIGALLPVVGISGMLRLMKANVIAKSGAAVEAAGNINVMMLDKTGTITMGDRQAREFYPREGLSERDLAADAQLASLADTTPEGRSIVVLAKERFGIREEQYNSTSMKFIGFSAQTRMSGVDLPDRLLRKGACSAIEQWLKNQHMELPDEIRRKVGEIASMGGTPLVLADNKHGAQGVIALRDVIKGGLKERFAELRELKIETVMVTGDNALTAAAVAAAPP